MKKLIGKTIVDYTFKEPDQVIFFCNDADYFYQIKPKSAGVIILQTHPGVINVVDIKKSPNQIDVIGEGNNITINFIDEKGNYKESKLVFKGKDNED